MKYPLMNEAVAAEGSGEVSGSESGSLLSAAPEAAATVEQQVASQGPAVERPEWLLDKYATDDRDTSEAISEQAKAYVELQKQFGGFTGAPESYEFSMPEGVEGEVDTELDAYKQFTEFAREQNMSQEAAQGLFNIFVGYQQSMESQFQTDFNTEKEKLGPTADERIGAVAQWTHANLEPDDISILETMTTTADQISVLEKLIGKTRNTPIPKTNQVTAPVTGFTKHDFDTAVASERFRNDPSYRAEIRKKAAALFPGGES